MTDFAYRYTVRYNEARDEHGRHLAWVRGYQPGDPLRDIYIGIVYGDTPEAALDQLFRRFNIVDGYETPALIGERSMSVGDVVTLELVRLGTEPNEPVASYAVADVGWDILRTADLNA